MSEKNVALQEEIVNDLMVELKDEPTFDEEKLRSKVKSAIREVRLRRRYTSTSYSEEQIQCDLYEHYSVIRSLALYDYNQIGAEFQTAHSENSINRTWIERNEILNDVVSFVRILS